MAIRTRKVVPKPVQYTAVKFTGKNSKDVAEWVNETGGKARAAGVRVSLLNEFGEIQMSVPKNTYVLLDPKGNYMLVEDEDYRRNFVGAPKEG